MYKHTFILVFTVGCVLAANEFYEGHALYEVPAKDVQEARKVTEIENKLDLDIWSYSNTNRPGQVLVPKEKRQIFEEELNNAGINYKIATQDIKEFIDLERKLLEDAAVNNSANFPFDSIHRLDVIYRYLEDVADRFPNIVTMSIAGRSIEGREIRYVKISTTNFEDRSKPVVVIQSLLHAREWVTLPVAYQVIEQLVVHGAEPELLNSIDWIVIPVANPDGYEFSHTNTRFWRKNRRSGLTIGNICMGVDLNRNFDVLWGTASSNNACTDTFHGHHPFSEPETSVIRDILDAQRGRIAMYADIHSFGSMVLYGYGNGNLPANALILNVGGVIMANRIDQVKWPNKPNYIVGNIAAVLQYTASGGSSDYAMRVGIPFSYTYELPSYNSITGNVNGFLVDPDFIEQAGFETWEGLKVGVGYAVNNFTPSASTD